MILYLDYGGEKSLKSHVPNIRKYLSFSHNLKGPVVTQDKESWSPSPYLVKYFSPVTYGKKCLCHLVTFTHVDASLSWVSVDYREWNLYDRGHNRNKSSIRCKLFLAVKLLITIFVPMLNEPTRKNLNGNVSILCTSQDYEEFIYMIVVIIKLLH